MLNLFIIWEFEGVLFTKETFFLCVQKIHYLLVNLYFRA